MLYFAPRYNVRGRQLLSTNGKYYAVDLDLEALSSKPKAAISVISSKMLFISSSYAVDTTSTWAISTAGNRFCCPKVRRDSLFSGFSHNARRNYPQSRVGPFKKVRDNYPKTLLTLDTLFADANYEGVRKRNVIDWLSE